LPSPSTAITPASNTTRSPDVFVAALYFPGIQLLVVSGKYTVPQLLTERVNKKEYRDVYLDLNGASVAESKVFIEDPGADGFNRDAPNAANRDEARVGSYTLPPLLVDAAGRSVTSESGWHHRRREIVELFDSRMYGRVPDNAPAIRWDFTAQETHQVGGISVVTRHYLGHAAISYLSSPPLAIDLRIDLPVTLYEAVLGGKVRVPTLGNAVELSVPKNTSSGRTFRLKGKGLPKAGGTGDLFVTVRIMLPDGNDAELEALMEKWRDQHPYNPRSGLG